ncbi:MAG: ornithine carbamoyltransferase [Verrucomicrobiae bacterium]|nr:ornithine carbamoyltransferase [Verrucomicrobiae bacterium]
MRHFLSILDFSAQDIREVLALTKKLKMDRHLIQPLRGETWTLIFSKASTRTRVSFEVGLRELGANVIFLAAHDIQLGRGEPIRDTARVIGRMAHGAVIRTFAQQDVVDFARYSKIPTINALTDEEHPCQILTDIFTIEELRGPIEKQRVVFIGDGACNVPASWMLAAKQLQFELIIAAPSGYQPSEMLVKQTGVKVTASLEEAVKNADVLYTDVWVSMGKELEKETRLKALGGYQINEKILSLAKPDALVLHCLPAYRGLEITDSVLERHAETIFTEAENRLHVQKAIITFLKQSIHSQS